MTHNRRSNFLCGAALAAFLSVPVLGLPAHAIAAESQSGWVTMPARSYDVHKLRLDDLVANVSVSVADGPVTLQMAGNKDRVNALSVRQEGEVLHIEGHDKHQVWNWRNWFNFSRDDDAHAPKNLQLRITVPRGTPLAVDGLIGDARIGDTMGPLDLDVIASHATIGHVGATKLAISGSGQVDAADINGPLSIDLSGSGRINVGHCGPVDADLAGAGDTHFGAIQGGLTLDIAGSSSATADSVNGPVKVDIAGSGSVKIASGQANPLKLSIAGSGNFDFGGMAVDPKLSSFGSGQVRLKAYSGHLSTEGNLHLVVNGQSVQASSSGDDD